MEIDLSGLVTFLLVVGFYLALGFVIERIWPAERNQPLRHVLFNVAYAPVYVASILLLAPLVGSWLPKVEINGFYVGFATTWYGAIAQTLLFAAMYDFFYYWWHRAQHTWAPLWAIHRLHHTERSLNVTSSVRHHWLEETLRPLVVLFPLGVFFSFQPVSFVAVVLLFAAWPFFIHMNARVRLGWLSYVLMGPQYHRIHHSIEDKHWNKNFGAFTPIWDIIFGTAYHPKKNEWPATGLVDDSGEPAPSFREALLAPFRGWVTALRNRT